MCFSSIAFIFLLDLAAITNSSLCSSIFEITFLLKNSLSMYSTSPTGSANHLSPLRFQTFNEKYFEIGMKLNDFSIQLVKYCILKRNLKEFLGEINKKIKLAGNQTKLDIEATYEQTKVRSKELTFIALRYYIIRYE